MTQHRAWIDVQLQNALRDWRRFDGPLYAQLSAALRAAIEAGELPAGRMLPPERILAAHLEVGRRTVARAYEALSDRGLVDRRQGAGTRVIGTLVRSEDNRAAKRTTSLQRNIVFAGLSRRADDVIDLLSVYMPGGTAVTADTLHAAADELARLSSHDHGYAPTGYPPLREALAARFSAQGIPTTPERILITSGAQQATALVATDFVQPGDTAVVEDPTLPGVIDVFRTLGARTLTVPPGDVDALENTLRRNAVGGVHLLPTFQSPTGGVLGADARRRAATLCGELPLGMMEDLTVADLWLEHAPPPPIAAYAPEAPVFTIGSLSKIFWAGVRVGWVRGPTETIAHLGRLKAVTDLGTSMVAQVVALHLLDRLDMMLETRRSELRTKLDDMELRLAGFDGWTWRRPAGGLSLWVRLPYGSAQAFALLAREHGVNVAPGTVTSALDRFDDHIRLPFAYDTDVTDEAMRRLASAWHDFTARTG